MPYVHAADQGRIRRLGAGGLRASLDRRFTAGQGLFMPERIQPALSGGVYQLLQERVILFVLGDGNGGDLRARTGRELDGPIWFRDLLDGLFSHIGEQGSETASCYLNHMGMKDSTDLPIGSFGKQEQTPGQDIRTLPQPYQQGSH